MSGYLCVGECQHYIEQDIYIIKLKQEIKELKAKESKWQEMCDNFHETSMLADEFENEPHDPCIFGEFVKGCVDQVQELKQQLAEKDKIICQLIKDCTNYQNTLCDYMYKDEVSENYKLTMQEIIKQAEQSAKGVKS
jgi:hypothetical protein